MDKRVIKTQQKLWDALFTLLPQQTIDEITVTQLCTTAGVSRRTFYRHFANVIAVFDGYSDYLNQQAQQTLSRQYADVNQLLNEFGRLVMANYVGLRELYTDPRHLRLVQNFVDAFYESLCHGVLAAQNSVHDRLVMRFIANGVLGMLGEWFKTMPDVPYREFAKMIKPLIKGNLGMVTG